MLRSYIGYKQDDWDKWLPALEFAYNNATNTATGFSPFYFNLGYHPLTPFSPLIPSSNTLVPSVNEFINNQIITHTIAKESLIQSQQQQKENYDKNHQQTTFEEGQQVLLDTSNITIASRKQQPS